MTTTTVQTRRPRRPATSTPPWWHVALTRPPAIWPLTPMALTLDDGPWSVACDGRRLIAVPGVTDGCDDAARVLGPDSLAAVRTWLSPFAAKRKRLDTFRAWLSDGLAPAVCVWCRVPFGKPHRLRGTGCDKGEVGVYDVATIGANIGPAQFNRYLLLDTFAAAPGEWISIERPGEPMAMARFAGEGWRAVVMPTRYVAGGIRWRGP